MKSILHCQAVEGQRAEVCTEYKPLVMRFRASCTNVVHDLGSAEPRSRVEPSLRWIMLHQVELGSADPVQLNVRGYTVDDSDWSSRAQPVGQWRHSHMCSC